MTIACWPGPTGRPPRWPWGWCCRGSRCGRPGSDEAGDASGVGVGVVHHRRLEERRVHVADIHAVVATFEAGGITQRSNAGFAGHVGPIEGRMDEGGHRRDSKQVALALLHMREGSAEGSPDPR